ncbi:MULTISPECIES: phage major capsid protein [unclassified Bacillus (in: firmicutes)]|uniref:phage major capsid protein n=1 Tax=unclassified Bacillus (in: firmicutes) TaxID=185979 RepID=UPI001BE577F1|nr:MULTISPECIES: phage major capsid protein [unclassified Bacillus (in: firmicutes)]MBT2615325.1 phage major capsid protein [Bacillus sp. ISL-78]MBT2628061.1 phage major capsid protein [Bacillus sp. ISL-101]MBT2717978.1 phage major capsid protein [Bacillus sp. ISL-57]
MTMKLKGKMENFEAKKAAYMNLVKAEEQDAEKLALAWDEMQSALAEDLTEKITTQVRTQQMDAQILTARGQNVLTSEERKFFNEVISSEGFAEESILPVTTQERIFEDLVQEHPLLDAIGLQDLGAVTRFITSDPTKAYAWGKLFGEIKGQVSAAFSEEQIGQLKLTAFAVIPKDMLELGPEWVERYVRNLLVESYSVGLEYGLVNGRGPSQNEPVGLMKNVAENGAVTDKTTSGTLTFAPSQFGEIIAGELHDVIKALSTNEEGKARKVLNKIVMVVNPIDAISVQARNTIQTANGQWVTALPYNIQVVESEEIPDGKTLFFVKGQYLAAVAGGYKANKFDQTLAIEDAMLYTIKQFANGKPKDNKAALVYALDITFTAAPAGV